MKTRSYAIDFYKFVFSMIIVLFHGWTIMAEKGDPVILRNGRLAVEFFFLISGFFMAKHADGSELKDIGQDTFLFIKGKYLRLVPNYYIAWIISFMLTHIYKSQVGIKKVIYDIFSSLPELLLLEQSGVSEQKYLGGGVWYLSAMLIAMAIIYPVIRINKNVFFNVISPLGFILICGYCYQEFGKLSGPSAWHFIACKGLVRAFMDILGGTICYSISKFVKEYKYTQIMVILFSIIEWGAFGGAIILMQKTKPSGMDFLVLFLLMMGVTVMVSDVSLDNRIIKGKIFPWLGEFSFSLYLSHIYLGRMIDEVFKWSFSLKFAVFLGLSLVTGLFNMYISRFIRVIFARNKGKVKKLIIQS